MGRKQNRIAAWSKMRAQRQKLRVEGARALDTNVFLLDPEKQKADRLLRRKERAAAAHLEALKSSKSKKELRRMAALKKKKKEAVLTASLLHSLKCTQLDADELKLLVSSKHKETKKERLRRVFAFKKAGLKVDTSELYVKRKTENFAESGDSMSGHLSAICSNATTDSCKNPMTDSTFVDWDFGQLSALPSASSHSDYCGHIETASGKAPMFESSLTQRYTVEHTKGVVSTRHIDTAKKRRRLNENVILDKRTEAQKLGDYSSVIPLAVTKAHSIDTGIALKRRPLATGSVETFEHSTSGKRQSAALALDRRLEANSLRAQIADSSDSDESSSALSVGDEEVFGVYGEGVELRAKALRREKRIILAEETSALSRKGKCKKRKFSSQMAECRKVGKLMRLCAVSVIRPVKMQEARSKLPIVSEEQRVMECIRYNDVVLICGETGCGKSTQVPQFLYEYGYAHSGVRKSAIGGGTHRGGGGLLIGVTEPRRVAAMSVSARVGEELGLVQKVAYQIRFDSKQVSDETAIKFMTDGILLREIQSDALLRKYGCVVVDEAHERNLNTDVLIGLLSRIVSKRRRLFAEGKEGSGLLPLKLIIMSATLRVEDFVENELLFPKSKPPVLRIPARQYPVTVHFNKKTPHREADYLNDVFKKVCKIHVTLPKGHILVFLTGKQQIEAMCKRLRQRFKFPGADRLPVAEPREEEEEEAADRGEVDAFLFEDSEDEKEKCRVKKRKIKKKRKKKSLEERIVSDAEDENDSDEDSSALGSEEDVDLQTGARVEAWHSRTYGCMKVCALYSAMAAERQREVFAQVPAGVRLVVVATNIAETSITIPGVKYVVDCGRCKQLRYEATQNMSTMEVALISKASAVQRTGRGGRTGPGHCYRLYSAAFYQQYFPEHFEPEISRVPIDGTVLQLKAMNIGCVSRFPLPTPPKADAVFGALRTLELLGALKYEDERYGESGAVKNKLLMHSEMGSGLQAADECSLKATALGRALVNYPLSVRCAKMLSLAKQGNCLPYAVAMVALLSAEPLQLSAAEMDASIQKAQHREDNGEDNVEDNVEDKGQYKAQRIARRKLIEDCRKCFLKPDSDVLTALNILGALSVADSSLDFSRRFFLRYKNATECLKLCTQLRTVLRKLHCGLSPLALRMPSAPPTAGQCILLRQLVAAGFIDQIARKWPHRGDDDSATAVRSTAYQCLSRCEERAYIHPHSVVANGGVKSGGAPEFVVYASLQRSETTDFGSRRLYMRKVTAIESHWLPTIAAHLCQMSAPLEKPRPHYDADKDEVRCFVEVRFGPGQWPLPVFNTRVEDSKLRIRLFARFLLEGNVFADAKKLRPYLRYSPQILKSQMLNLAATELLLALERKRVCSKQSLSREWRKEPAFLRSELRMWLFDSKRYLLDSLPFTK